MATRTGDRGAYAGERAEVGGGWVDVFVIWALAAHGKALAER
jgi:hypothetical protein